MVPRLSIGDRVQTRLGKGVVLEVRRAHVLVEIAGRRVVVEAGAVTPVDPPRKSSRKHAPSRPAASPHGETLPERYAAPAEIDLHGLFVADALARVESAINDALLAGRLQLRVIHGRSGGRIRAALHRYLRALPPVRSFRLDPANEGVTVVEF
jgi:DNA mismatch repair protein MutS2